MQQNCVDPLAILTVLTVFTPQSVYQTRRVAGAEAVVDPECFGVNVDDGAAADSSETIEVGEFHPAVLGLIDFA